MVITTAAIAATQNTTSTAAVGRLADHKPDPVIHRRPVHGVGEPDPRQSSARNESDLADVITSQIMRSGTA